MAKSDKVNSVQKYKFQKLTPVNDIDLAIYEDAFDFIFKNGDLRNIAISGPYSSGKSSIIETYKSKNKGKNFLHISLAHFTEIQKEEPGKDPKKNEAILEGKILNQLLHQINAKKIPQTNFKIKRKVHGGKIFLNTLLLMLSGLSSVYMLNFSNLQENSYLPSNGFFKNAMTILTNHNAIFIGGLILLGSLSFIVYSLIKAQMNKNIFKKLSLQGNEFEISGDNNESYFDKYLNEVLYLFENANADVIVFEDMDRYDANQIFVKLREINILVNNKSDKIIRFFYLLRDDIFISKERTKFFDFILPVVPVMDGSNSYDQFLSHFVDGGINNLFDNYFLQGLSLYIDDMRILKNIYNEFIVYYDKIRSIELDNNKLLAIIVYKNLFPRDFSELQLSRGYVFSVLDGKNTYIQDEIQKINRQIEKIEERIKIATQENLESLDELDTLFLRISPRLNFQIDGGVHYDLQSNIAIVKAMKKSPDNIQIFFNNNSDRMPFDIKNAINSLNENQEYLKRKGIINDKSAKNLNELTQKKQDLQEVSGNIAGKHLKDIINRDNVDIIFKEKSNSEADNQKLFQDIISNDYYPLIKYLIRNGYIDETYSDYMTYFYENSISKEDKIFLRSVADELAKGCDFKLKNPKLIVSRLQATDFEHEETLNFDLLAYLLKNREASSLYIKKLIGQLKKNNNALFVSQFLERRSDLEAFFAVLVDNWPNIADVYLNSFDTNKKQREDFSIDAVNYLPDSKIVKLNINNVLSNFISEFSEFLNQKDCDIDKIIKGLKILSVKFVRINPDGLNVDFIDGVYQNDMYQINFDNISFILNTIYKREKSDDFKHKNYSLVRSKQNEPLNKYIQENINDYMNIVIKNSDNSISDDEKCAIQILNNKNIDMTIKDRYISILTTVISDITEIEDNGLWDNLIENNIAENSENNIFAYYFSNENGLNETLIDFINKHEGTFTISEEDIDNDYGEGSTSKFVDNVIECDELKDDIYENILRSSGYEYDDFSIKEVSSSKILILVNIELILMTKENLLLFRENYPKQKIFFITKNIDKYIELLDDSIMINEEILCLLEENISDEAKLKLLNKTNGEISIKGKKYSESVMIQILKNNFDINEIPLLLKSFDNESKNIKEIIFNIISNNIDFLLENETPISFEILRSILNLAEIDRDTKKNLFVMHLLNINENQIKECFELMGMTDYLSLFEHKRPKFLIDPINERILTGLKEKKVIKSFKPDQKNTDYYRAY